MAEIKRILHIIGGLDRGGAESFLMNAWRNIDKTKYQFDIITFMQPREGNKFVFEDELVKGGAKIYRIKDNRTKAPWIFKRDIANIVKEGNYEVVHSHIDFMSAISLQGAKMGGAKCRISHSHNTFNKNLNSPGKALIAHVLRRKLNKIATKKLACGKDAGEFLYGKGQDFTVIPNGIDLSRFSFNKTTRAKLRKTYKLNNATKVLLNVGRLEDVKNQSWLIQVFENIHKKQPNSALFIIGDGALKDSLQAQINHSSAKSSIFLLSSRPDINDYYSLADIFVLPSKFEGVPTVGVEAQAAGLTCFFSTFVPREVKASKNVFFLSIDSKNSWEKKLTNYTPNEDRKPDNKSLEKYNIKNSVKKLEAAYDSI